MYAVEMFWYKSPLLGNIILVEILCFVDDTTDDGVLWLHLIPHI